MTQDRDSRRATVAEWTLNSRAAVAVLFAVIQTRKGTRRSCEHQNLSPSLTQKPDGIYHPSRLNQPENVGVQDRSVQKLSADTQAETVHE